MINSEDVVLCYRNSHHLLIVSMQKNVIIFDFSMYCLSHSDTFVFLHGIKNLLVCVQMQLTVGPLQ